MELMVNEALKIKLGWLIKIRYLNCLGALTLAILAASIRFIDNHAFYLILFVVSVVMVINFLTAQIWKDPKRPISDISIFFQLLIDLMALTQILIIAGRPAVALHSLYMILAALGALLLGRKMGFFYFILLFLCLVLTQYISFDPMTLINASHARDVFLRLSIFHIPLIVIWVVARSLGNYLEMIADKMVNLELQNEKMDRLRAVGALAAGISHEFASPLNIVKLRLNRLHKQVGENENLSEALEAIDRCEDAVKSLNAAQIDHRETESEWIELQEDLEKIVESRFGKCFPLDKKIRLFVPRLSFSTILLNIIDNAYQAKADTLKITSRHNKNKFELIISDNGTGLNGDVVKEVGNPFFTTKNEGTGLGIYSARLFMESLGGELIIANNKNDKGACVTLRFPFKLTEEYES
jgi:two-component system sensor histidine kinase RegB